MIHPPDCSTSVYKALALLSTGEDAPADTETLLEAVANREISVDGLQFVERDGEVVAAMLAHLQGDSSQSGGTVHLLPPAWTESATDADVDVVVSRCQQWIRARSTSMSQCITSDEAVAVHRLLERHGFERLTDLTCWHHSLNDIPHATLPDEIDAIEWTPDLTARLEAVLQETWTDSQDCRSLQHRRTASDCLKGHQHAASAGSRHWQIYCDASGDVGVVLCAIHPDQRMWELLYFGVVPFLRRQGLGTAMLAELLWEARDYGADGLYLAADSANTAAAALYTACGFTPTFQQRIHIWFPPSDE